MRDGELFVLALLLNKKRSANIVAGTATELVSISKDSLNELVSSGSEATKNLINQMCEELSKRSEFQKSPCSKKELDEILFNENKIITKLAQQIYYRLEKSPII